MDTTTDWQVGKTLPNRINYMLENELMCDVTFQVGANRTPIKAHKFMLASASPVFYRMFNEPMAETGDVKIPDIEVNIFQEIINYIYTDSIKFDATNISGLMYGSEKYMLHDIKRECGDYLQSSLDEECACDILQTAHGIHRDDIQTNILEFILNRGEACLNSKSFLNLSPECLRLVIESDYLVCGEEIIYQKIIEWSTNRCQDRRLTVNDENIRQDLGDLLNLVRFPIMQRKYFTENVSKKNVLSFDEILNVYQTPDDVKNAVFPTKGRRAKYMVFLRCDTDKSVESTNDCLDFSTGNDCIMLGINVFGSTTYSGKHDIRLAVLKSSKVLSSMETVLYSKKGQEMYPLMFGRPIHVKNNTRYTIKLNMKGPKAFTGKSYRRNVRLNRISVQFSNSVLGSQTMASTNENMGQIPGIIMQYI